MVLSKDEPLLVSASGVSRSRRDLRRLRLARAVSLPAVSNPQPAQLVLITGIVYAEEDKLIVGR